MDVLNRIKDAIVRVAKAFWNHSITVCVVSALTVNVIGGYYNFKGRLNRRDYWICIAVFAIVYGIADWFTLIPHMGHIMEYLVVLACITPYAALTVRRLRDAGFDPRWALFSILPVIGTGINLAMCTEKSKDAAVEEPAKN